MMMFVLIIVILGMLDNSSSAVRLACDDCN